VNAKEEIEDLIQGGLPILFERAAPVDRKDFSEKYDALNDCASASSAPYLSADTIRYQTIIVVYSLLLASISLLKIKGVKVFEAVVVVNHKLRVIYIAFIAVVTIVFLIKVWSDQKRAKFSGNKKDQAVSELTRLIKRGILKKTIQHHFWIKIFESIGRTYKAYVDAQREVINNPQPFEPGELPVKLPVDLGELRKDPELATEIESQERNFGRISILLAKDESKFKHEAKALLDAHRAAPKDVYSMLRSNTYEKLELAYKDSLGPWMDARMALSDEVLRLVLKPSPENQSLEAIVKILKQLRLVRRVYVALEIIAPLAFAAVVSWYVLSH